MSQIRADNITNRQGTGAPIFVNGIRVVGLTSISNIVANTGTFSGAVSIGGTLTYEDVTNIDAVGLITARNGIDITGGDLNAASNLILKTGGSEKARIDSSGNVLVGTTDATVYNNSGNGNDGIVLRGGNVIDIARSSDLQLTLNRLVNDGSMVGFYRDGAHKATINIDNNALTFGTNGNTERLRITTSGVKVTGGYTENIVAVSGTAVDCSTASYFTKTITGATTFTFTNVPSGVAYAFTFEVTLNGSNAITWPSSVKWPADTAPTITDGKTQVFIFLTDDGGTRWRGSSLVDYTN